MGTHLAPIQPENRGSPALEQIAILEYRSLEGTAELDSAARPKVSA
jgi:hypothetical protein